MGRVQGAWDEEEGVSSGDYGHGHGLMNLNTYQPFQRFHGHRDVTIGSLSITSDDEGHSLSLVTQPVFVCLYLLDDTVEYPT